MKLTVYHMIMDRTTGQQLVSNGCPMFVPVAEFQFSDKVDQNVALEHAWRYTNNTEGSWSGGDRNYSNEDYSPDTKVLEPLANVDGKEWGHRSSMMGDVFGLGEKSFEVAMFGFKEKK